MAYSGGITNLHTLAFAKLNGAAPLELDQLTGVNYNRGVSEIIQGADGLLDAISGSIGAANPRVTLSSTKITLLDSLLAPTKIGTGQTYTSFVGGFRRVDGSGPSLTGNGISLTISEGCIVPQTLVATGRTLASLSFEVAGKSDSSQASPVVSAGSAAFDSSSTLDAIVGYKLGPIKIGSSFMTGIQSLTIDFGYAITDPESDGLTYATALGVLARGISITGDLSDISFLGTPTGAYSPAGASISDLGGCSIFLRGVARGGDIVAETAETNIKISLGAGRFVVGGGGAVQGAPASSTFSIYPYLVDGADLPIPLTIDTTSAIS